MKLTVRKLKKVLKSIEPIRIEFDEYDYNSKGIDTGSYYNEDYEILNKDVFIICEIGVESTYSLTPKTTITPLEVNQESSNEYISIKKVFIDEDEYKPNAEQLRAIEKEIRYNLMY